MAHDAKLERLDAMHVQKWGNGLAVRIPRAHANELHWRQNTEVCASIVDGKLVLEAVTTPKYRLADLLARVTPENRHDEVDSSPSVGDEAW